MINLIGETAVAGLRVAIDLLKVEKAPYFKIRDRYYYERARAIRKRGKSLLSAQKVLLAKSGVYKSSVFRETQAEVELDLMALIHEDEVMRYNASIQI